MVVRQLSEHEQSYENHAMQALVPGVLALFAAVPVAYLIYCITNAMPNRPERALQIIGGLFSLCVMLSIAIYLLRQRRSISPARVGLLLLATVSVFLVAVYFYWVSFSIFFPADILIWSESDFVNDILKFRVGYPLYTAQANNESFTYVPGTQLLTYFIAWILGQSTSIPFYRIIQVGYTFVGTIVAFLCCRRLAMMSGPVQQLRDRRLWSVCWLPMLFLIATNSLTNPFVGNLHNDALAQLISMVAYWLLLEYAVTRNKRVLALMAIVPAIGFLVKQSLGIWALLYCVYLGVFERPRVVVRLLTFALVAFGGIGGVVVGCYLLWGEHFIYWVFTVMGHHAVSPLRSFQHLLDVWPYCVIGLVGGLVLIRQRNFAFLIGPWAIWLALFLIEVYTSGIAWMLNHIGPASLIAGIWLLAALARVWPFVPLNGDTRSRPQMWLHTGIAVAIICLLLSGLKVVRIPLSPFSDDAYRYIAEIDREFQGQATDKVLLDTGTWLYLKKGVVMQDRSPSIGERGYTETGDFSGIIGRLKQRRYAKILVRDLHSPEFQYDYWLWQQPSGIRQALLENYHEVGTIRAVKHAAWQGHGQSIPLNFRQVSILLPKAE